VIQEKRPAFSELMVSVIVIYIRGVSNEFQRVIQGDAGEKACILGADIIGHCDKHISYEQLSDSERLPRYSCLITEESKNQLDAT